MRRPKLATCHSLHQPRSVPGKDRIVLVGPPNVGKSVIFHALTGAYVTVSNYPGTTVEITQGLGTFDHTEYEVIDTPGLHSLLPLTAEEEITRTLLFTTTPTAVVHVIDAKNLEKLLPLTLQLLEAELPVLLNLNLLDEAERVGMHIDSTALEQELGIPVAATVATTGQGITTLRQKIAERAQQPVSPSPPLTYPPAIEEALHRLLSLLTADYPIGKRALALLLLQEDPATHDMVKEGEGERYPEIARLVQETKAHHNPPLSYHIALARQQAATTIAQKVVTTREAKRRPLAEILNTLTLHPLTGFPLLFLVLYYGLYQFVGVFGAGTLVDFIEGKIFETHLNPWINAMVTRYVPWEILRSLLAEEYGIFTLGVRYAIAIILPIVGTFFLTFSLIEDSGYLPRIALLVDRLFKRIGLNGRAVIPMTLGFGCDTMATLVTRTLETTRERVIATLLLALAIPCSAQLGIVLALLAGNVRALLVWACFVGGVFLLIGFLTARLLPGESPSFYLELPPLRWPKPSNVLLKTYARIQWYFLEVLPLFILASVLIWLGKLSGAFDLGISLLKPLVRGIGLPEEAAVAFLFGFFRRDYGAAGLYDLQQSGALSGNQLVVAAATLTLFVPCIAQFSIMWKERGPKTTLAIVSFIFPFAFAMGYLLHLGLTLLGIQL